jgi:hypothetical protein
MRAASKVSPAGALSARAAVLALGWGASTLLGLGCGAPSADEPDAAVGRDAMLAEGGISIDAPESDGGAYDVGPDPGDAAATACASGPCDPRRPIETCAMGVCVLRDAVPLCVSRVGEAAEGSACESSEQCAQGLACFRGQDGGRCARVCCPASDRAFCGVAMRCSAEGTLANGVTTTWGQCAVRRPCDLLASRPSCAPREGCYIVYPRLPDQPQAECLYAGTADVGETCTEQNDCRPGLFCAGIRTRTCVRICRLASPTECAADERCVAQAYSPEGTGVCVSSSRP